MPLQNLSSDPAQEYFADGMTDGLITEVARIGSLRVISRTSIMRYKGVHKPLPVIAKELGVDAVVEGTITYGSGKVRITAQLIRASDDRHLWSEKYDRDLGDALKLQGEVAQAIAGQIKIKLTLPGAEHDCFGTRHVDPRAYEAYVEGSYFGSRVSGDSLDKSVALLTQAIELDPDYADGICRLVPFLLCNGNAGATAGRRGLPQGQGSRREGFGTGPNRRGSPQYAGRGQERVRLGLGGRRGGVSNVLSS